MMNDAHINTLIEALRETNEHLKLFWIPDSMTAKEVISIGTHVKNGPKTPCAVFNRGQHKVLADCELRHFALVARLI